MSERPLPAPIVSEATRDVARRQLALSALIVLVGTVTLLLGSWVAGVALLGAGAFLSGIAGLVRLSGSGVPLVNTAFNALLQGRVAEAERLLDQAESRYQLGYIHRVIDLQRASIALRRGDLQAALIRVESALARPPGLLTRAQEHPHLATARATRALLRASLGDQEGARADAEAVRRLPWAPAEALARAEVAEAIALERDGDREALGAHLARKRTLLLDSTTPRERAVVRAYQRMLAAPRTSIYRRGGARDAAEGPGARGQEPTLADWITRVAPAAAPFARASRPRDAGAAGTAPAPEDVATPGLIRVAEGRLEPTAGGPPASRARIAAVWVLLVVFFAAFWELFRGDIGEVPTVFSMLPRTGVVVGLFVGALAAVVAVAMARTARDDRRLATALGALARGEDGAVAEIEALAAISSSQVAPQAHRELARLAVRRGDFDEALRRCDQGVALVTARRSARAVADSMLLPDLVAERAFVLAATDRHAKASAEMAVLGKAFPAYPFLARAQLRVALVQRVRRGDLAGAAQLVGGDIDDLPLSLRDETLVDLVRATGHPESIGAGEAQRVTDDLRASPELRAWIVAVAPEALRAFEAAPGASKVSTEEARDADAASEAEAEALAAEEARQVMRR